MKNLAFVSGCAGCVLAGYLLTLAGKDKPAAPVDVTPAVAAEAPVESPPQPAAEPPQPAEAAPQPAAPCQHCGGDGLLDGPYGPLLCPTCGKGRSAQIPTFTVPAASEQRYTQPQEPPKAAPTEYVTVQQPYRYGLFGRRTGYRNVTMTRAAYEAQRGRQAEFIYGGGCANGRCGR